MTASDRWDRIDALFEKAGALPPDARAALLDEADPDVREQVERMLAAAADASDFFGRLGAHAGDLLEEALPDDAPPERIGPYRILGTLGHGGMGSVFLAERDDGQFHHRVALKLVRGGLHARDIVRRFLHERQILARLQHPHIARLLDGGLTDDGRPYFAMAFIDGEPITVYCDHHRLSVDQRLRLFEDVCDAVRYAHRSLVVHRDLKPSNILVTPGSGPGQAPEGQVKLLDFGIAKVLTPDSADGAPDSADGAAPADAPPLTETGMAVMTPAYAAPEQRRGDTITTATDVYALGVVLYELLCGRRPFGRDGVDAAAPALPVRPSTQVGQAKTAELAETRATTRERLRRTLRGDLDAICQRALRPEPEERYASVNALLEDLERYRTGRPVEARRGRWGYRARKFVGRNRLALGVAAVAVVFLLASAVFYTVRITQERNRAEAAAQTAEREAANTEEALAFLTGLFRTTDPYQQAEGADTDLTARELLARGAEQIRTELTDQPAAQGRLLGEIGWIYFNLGLYAEADSLLDAARALQEGLEGEERRLAETLHHIGRLKDEIGDYAAAREALEASLALRRRVYPDPHPKIAEALDQLGAHLTDDGDYDAAEPMLREAVAMLEATDGTRARVLATALHNLGRVLHRRGEFDEAESIYRRALVTTDSLYGENHPEALLTRSNLAVTLRQAGRLEEAESLYRRVLRGQREVLGEMHPQVGASYYNLCTVLGRRERFAEAESACAAAVSIWRTVHGDDDPYVFLGLNNLATLRYRQGDLAAAEPLFREALAGTRRYRAPDHPDIARIQLDLGKTVLDAGRPGEAEPLLRDARRIYIDQLGPDNPRTALVEAALGRTFLAQRRFAEAESLLVAAYALLRAERGEEHEYTVYAREGLDALRAARGETP